MIMSEYQYRQETSTPDSSSQKNTSWRPPIERKEKDWQKTLKNFAEKSSFSSVLYKFKSRSLVKRATWCGVVTAAVVGFSIVTALSIQMLVAEPIVTSITVSREETLEFPAVTVCSLSFLNTTQLVEFDRVFGLQDHSLSNRLLRLIDYARQMTPDTKGCNDVAREIYKVTRYNESFGVLITKHARNNPRVLVKECSFLGKNCKDDLTEIDTVSGVCITFNGPNSGTVRKVSGTGSRLGLRLQLMNGDQLFSLGLNYGYVVVIHNRDEPPRPESEGVAVGLNSTLYVGMRQVISIDNTKFHSRVPCTREAENRNSQLSVKHYSTYSPALCLNECFYKVVADKCACVEKEFYTPTNSPYTEMPPCDIFNVCCEIETFKALNDSCYCPPKCETVEHSLTVSSATHATDGMVGINVYYESLLSEVRETTDAYTPWSLISDIGGNTGLFLGFTLLTVAEVVMLAVGLLTDCCCSSLKSHLNTYLHAEEPNKKDPIP